MKDSYIISMTDLTALTVDFKSLPSNFPFEFEEFTTKSDADSRAARELKIFNSTINVRRDGNPDPSDFTFNKTKFDFKDASDLQLLMINTEQLRTISIIENLSIELADISKHIHLKEMAVDHQLPQWTPVRLTDKFNVNAKQILIAFRTPPRTPYFRFFIRLHLKRSFRNLPYFDCDPQVGNDPPVIPETTPCP